MTPIRWPDDDVILYDGVCIFCSRWVRFVATRDVARKFRFTAIQSPYGTRLAQAFGINPDDPDTNAVVHGGAAHFKSDGALTVLSQLDALAVPGAQAAARPDLRSGGAQPLQDFRKI
jgi:predicted DCC family thiol-disulfide oxidoreductase YuxK